MASHRYLGVRSYSEMVLRQLLSSLPTFAIPLQVSLPGLWTKNMANWFSASVSWMTDLLYGLEGYDLLFLLALLFLGVFFFFFERPPLGVCVCVLAFAAERWALILPPEREPDTWFGQEVELGAVRRLAGFHIYSCSIVGSHFLRHSSSFWLGGLCYGRVVLKDLSAFCLVGSTDGVYSWALVVRNGMDYKLNWVDSAWVPCLMAFKVQLFWCQSLVHWLVES